jgi:hypothetical protein
MSDKAPKSLEELLGSGRLAALGTEARRRRETTARIRALLPADAAPHLVSASRTEDGALLLTMDSSVWAARVRYLGEHLGAERVRVRVNPIGGT